ncbi:MAG: type II toxin-antitoxin system VapC family toxin [Blastocatellia bacterium]
MLFEWPNAEIVRQFAYQVDSLVSCEIARVELFSVGHRHQRENNITSDEARQVLKDLEQDEQDGVWEWLPLNPALIRSVCDSIINLPNTAFLRAVDAIHLACAREHGLTEI